MSAPFTLSEDDQHKLILHRTGQEDVRDVRIRRAFPWSKPNQFISVRTSEGKELMLIENLDTVEPAQRQTITRWLDGNSFIPRITRVHEIDARFGYQQWKVETDRGPIEFRVQEREDIRFLHDGRFSVKDADGNVYELTSIDKLDPVSRKAVETLL
jgi:hypothetical protein